MTGCRKKCRAMSCPTHSRMAVPNSASAGSSTGLTRETFRSAIRCQLRDCRNQAAAATACPRLELDRFEERYFIERLSTATHTPVPDEACWRAIFIKQPRALHASQLPETIKARLQS